MTATLSSRLNQILSRITDQEFHQQVGGRLDTLLGAAAGYASSVEATVEAALAG